MGLTIKAGDLDELPDDRDETELFDLNETIHIAEPDRDLEIIVTLPEDLLIVDEDVELPLE